METGHAKKGKRRPTPRHRRPAGSARPATLLPAVGAAPSRPGAECAGRAGKFDEFPKNSINFDKIREISEGGIPDKLLSFSRLLSNLS